MNPRGRVAAWLLGSSVLLLLSCAAGPDGPARTPTTASAFGASQTASLKDAYAQRASAGGRVFELDPARSAVRIYVFRGGLAAKVGHNHVLSAPKFAGYFYLPTTGAADARFDLVFRLDELEIDLPEHRAGLGSAFASVLSPEAIEGTRDHMLGASNMQADQFPYVRIHGLAVSGESPRFAAKVEIELHGQTRQAWVPLTVTGLPDALSVSGSMVIRQTDFGAKPYSVAGGMLSVRDEVIVDFNLTGR